jgi:hypothetical protein
MKVTKDTVEFSADELVTMMNSHGGVRTEGICENCGTLLPMPEWAKRIHECPVCKDYPSMEDRTGQRYSWTPDDWAPKH